MNITKENIVEESTMVNINWPRHHTPYTQDHRELRVDSAEFKIVHNGIEKLECAINDDNEYIMCFVHFKHNTKESAGIYFSVWNTEGTSDSPILVDLDEAEIEMLNHYALEKIADEIETISQEGCKMNGICYLYDFYPKMLPL